MLGVFALAGIAEGRGGDAPQPPAAVQFDSFTYTGRDLAFEAPLAKDEYRNPVLAGFYPDPDICRVEGDYYLVNSSFAYFPGIPVFHSTDLVNWTQVGNAVDRPSQLDYDGLGVSRGIFAPAISHHGETFYLVCTFVDAGGNFLMTARNPGGPWSDPTWLGFDGIDPSLFFDADGRAWIVSNGAPPDDKPLYSGHRAIHLREFDPVAKKVVGASEIIVNGGVDIAKQPVWIEGPHLFAEDGWYYLICAEGGTAEDHSEVVFRSRSIHGPFLPGPSNPILTQRALPPSREHPITCTGHADFLQAADGTWWSVFLGCRPYGGDYFNTGRETFMLPVTWTDGWPSILPGGKTVSYTVPGPADQGLASEAAVPLTGNFTWRDDFNGPSLSPLWLMLRRPQETWWSVGPAAHLRLVPRGATLSGTENPSFLGRRLQHARFDATLRLTPPSSMGVSAGLAAFQNEEHHFFLGTRKISAAENEIFVESSDGPSSGAKVVAARAGMGAIDLRITGNDRILEFAYATAPGAWERLGGAFDATVLSTKAAGGFVGAVIGPYARIDP
jgi:alpha-N-arabinofuranosidase